MADIHRHLSKIYLGFFALMVFASYPLALVANSLQDLQPFVFRHFPSVNYTDMPFHLPVPALFLLTILAIPVIIASPRLPRRWLLVSIALFILSVVYASLRFPGHPMKAVEILGQVLVPLAVATTVGSLKLDANRLKAWGAWLWVVYVLCGLYSVATNTEVIGLSGNRNWAGSMYLATGIAAFFYLRKGEIFGSRAAWAVVIFLLIIPAAYLLAHYGSPPVWAGLVVAVIGAILYKYRKVFGQSTVFRKATIWPLVALLVTAPTTIALAYECRSRGAWLALIVLAIVLIFAHIRWIERVLFAVFLTLAGVVIVVFVLAGRPTSPVDAIEDDVRLPMWVTTARMTRDNDLLLSGLTGIFSPSNVARPDAAATGSMNLGVGPGHFTKAFTPYRARSHYHERLNAAAVTIHPHNEFLNIAAQIGILAAIAWLCLLLPLCRRNDPDDPLFNIGRPLAFLIYFHGFFDMTMVQQPGNIVAMFALGLCLQRYLTATVELKESSLGLQIQRAVVSLAVMAAILTAALCGKQSMIVEAHMRNAIIAEEYGKFEKAYDHYVAVTKLQRGKINGHLFAGVVALDRLDDPKAAIPHLQEAVKLDENYGHLNAKLGAAVGMLNNHALALKCYERECYFFPNSEEAFQRLLMSLAINHKYSRMMAVVDRLDHIYQKKAGLEHPYGKLDELARKWRRQVVMKQHEPAIATAHELCNQINPAFVDPLFYLLAQNQEWPKGFIDESFNESDYFYWMQVFLCDAVNKASREEYPDLHPLERINKMITENITIDAQSSDFEFPDTLWAKRRGSLISCYTLLAAMAEQEGYFVVIQRDTLNKPEYVVIFDEDETWHLDLATDFILQIADGVVPMEWTPGATQIIVLPQQFFLKNQVLGQLVRRQTGMAMLDDIPTMRLLAAIKATSDKPVTYHGANRFIAPEPLETLYDLYNKKLAELEAQPQ